MQSTGNERDERLIGRLKQRDADAMAEVYDVYGRLAYAIIFQMVRDRSTAEDLTQDTFLRIWNGAQGFDQARGALKTWVVAVARNRAIDFLRSVEGRMVKETVELEEAATLTVSSRLSRQLLTLEAPHILRQAMAKLTANERLVLDLCYREGMTHAEIADCLDRPLGTVKTWLRRAVLSMRECLDCSSDLGAAASSGS